MRINEIEKMDTVVAIVTKTTRNNGTYLKIEELEDANPIVKLFDWVGHEGDRLLVSIRKISEDRGYIKTTLDSIVNARGPVAA